MLLSLHSSKKTRVCPIGVTDLKSANAWALFYMGRSIEARVINDQLLTARNHPADLLLDTNLAIQSGDWERFPAIVEREWESEIRMTPACCYALHPLLRKQTQVLVEPSI